MIRLSLRPEGARPGLAFWPLPEHALLLLPLESVSHKELEKCYSIVRSSTFVIEYWVGRVHIIVEPTPGRPPSCLQTIPRRGNLQPR